MTRRAGLGTHIRTSLNLEVASRHSRRGDGEERDGSEDLGEELHDKDVGDRLVRWSLMLEDDLSTAFILLLLTAR